MNNPTHVAVLGGTGPQGRGLALHFARAGHAVYVGSRDAARAQETADEITARIEGVGPRPQGLANADALAATEIVLLAVPYAGQDALVEELGDKLADKIVISCVNPLGFDKAGPYGLDLGGTSAAETLQAALPSARVVGAFHHLAAASLWAADGFLDHEDVLVVADDIEAKNRVVDLAGAVTGRPGVDAGPLRLARQLEPLTAVFISINKRYKIRSGIRVAGL
jgi:NADPH-dependent F420 reductase